MNKDHRKVWGIGGMPPTDIFANQSGGITVRQVDGVDRPQLIVILPEMIERFCALLREVRDEVTNGDPS